MKFLIKVLLVALLTVTLSNTRNYAAPANLNNSPEPVAQQPVTVEDVKLEAKEVPVTVVAVPQPSSEQPKPLVGCEAYRQEVARYKWNVDVALNVMRVESGCRPTALNPEAHRDRHGRVICNGSRGLFQIGCTSTDNFKGMDDPAANIAQAYALYSRRGWQPWSYTTCKKIACY